VVPERDIFVQHKRYQALADYLSAKLGQPVQIAMLNTYQAVLLDLGEKKIDGAFVGSLVAVLAMDRLDARVLVRGDGMGRDTYCGVLIVPEDSPIRSVADLGGKSVGMVRTTTAGHLFPLWLLTREGLLLTVHTSPAHTVWVGTHDDLVAAVMSGQVDAGAVKDRRLEACLAEHPGWKVRRLAQSASVPEITLVLRADVAPVWGPRLSDTLLRMHEDERGRQTLRELGSSRYIVTLPHEYAAIYDMVDQLGQDWSLMGISGPALRRPSTRPAAQRMDDGRDGRHGRNGHGLYGQGNRGNVFVSSISSIPSISSMSSIEPFATGASVSHASP